jgi:hypothetical protein
MKNIQFKQRKIKNQANSTEPFKLDVISDSQVMKFWIRVQLRSLIPNQFNVKKEIMKKLQF